jgi:transposase
MAKQRRTYAREFKLEALQLWQTSGKSAAMIEGDLDIPRGMLYKWKRELGASPENAFPGHGRMSPADEELRQLRRELEIARQERDILKKAVAIFSHQSK